MVLLHGGGQTRHSWSRAAETLAGDGWTAVTYDARGHGDSDWQATGLLHRPLRRRSGARPGPGGRGRPACLAGASLGGMTALMAEARRPA
ncbi:alpha/beta fold hydrolase [Streptomyces sp. INA 01156]